MQRGFSVEDFTRLVRGEMEPKPREDAAASSTIISPTTVTTAATVRSVSMYNDAEKILKKKSHIQCQLEQEAERGAAPEHDLRQGDRAEEG